MRLGTTFALLAVLALALASGANADDTRPPLPHGTVIAGVVVGDLAHHAAKTKLQDELEPLYGRRISVRGGGARIRVEPGQAGQQIRYERMVDVAYERMARGEAAIDVPLMRRIQRPRLRRTVNRIARRWHRSARNASYRYGVRRVRIRGARFGRRVNKYRLRRSLLAEVRTPREHGRRIVRVRFVRIRPAITVRALRRRAGTFVSVHRRSKIVRLFKRLRVVRRYRVAVGKAGYATPRGLRRVLSKQRNPAWHAPNRSWAGDLAGQTIPPGDPRNPLKAAFISLGGGIGFHGTSALSSIGTNASHGCIRMRVRDVLHLYRKVPVGTPVLIR